MINENRKSVHFGTSDACIKDKSDVIEKVAFFCVDKPVKKPAHYFFKFLDPIGSR